MDSTTLGSHKARRMTVIMMHHSVVFFREVTNNIELGNRTVHRKNAICRNQYAPGTSLFSRL